MRSATIPLLYVLSLTACSAASPEPGAPRKIALPGPAGAPSYSVPPAPADPSGAAPISLVDREQRLWSQLVTQLYAPCPDQAVSLKQCVDEARPCVACGPAARLLAEKVKEGATDEQAREIYGLRFGPDVKKVDPADSPSRGPIDAPITIVVWSDFECPHCRHALPILEQAVTKYAPNVRLVHKFYPLHQHTYAEGAARAAIAAQGQGKYWEMEHVLFEHQGEQTEADLDKYARDLKLDMKRFRADMSSDRTTKILARDHAAAEDAGLGGTPFIVIDGRQFDTGLFHLDPDLDPWIALELQLRAPAAIPAKAGP